MSFPYSSYWFRFTHFQGCHLKVLRVLSYASWDRHVFRRYRFTNLSMLSAMASEHWNSFVMIIPCFWRATDKTDTLVGDRYPKRRISNKNNAANDYMLSTVFSVLDGLWSCTEFSFSCIWLFIPILSWLMGLAQISWVPQKSRPVYHRCSRPSSSLNIQPSFCRSPLSLPRSRSSNIGLAGRFP